jgi:hypothetical protein
LEAGRGRLAGKNATEEDNRRPIPLAAERPASNRSRRDGYWLAIWSAIGWQMI